MRKDYQNSTKESTITPNQYGRRLRDPEIFMVQPKNYNVKEYNQFLERQHQYRIKQDQLEKLKNQYNELTMFNFQPDKNIRNGTNYHTVRETIKKNPNYQFQRFKTGNFFYNY